VKALKLFRVSVLGPLVLLGAAESARCQVTTTQCNLTGASNNFLTFAAAGRSQPYDNRNLFCSNWTLQWWASSSITTLSIEIDQAQDINGAPGTWQRATTQAGSVLITGGNPSTSSSGITIIQTYAPWISVQMNSLSSGTVNYVMRALSPTPTQVVNSTQTNTYTPLTNSAVLDGSSMSLPNNGQNTHQIIASIGNNGGNTCAQATDAWLIMFVGIPPTGANVNILSLYLTGPAGVFQQSVGYGTFPAYQVSFTATGSAAADCTLTLSYMSSTGAIPAATSNIQYQTAGFLGTQGVLVYHPPTECSKTISITVAATTNGKIVNNQAIGSAIRVCTIVLTSTGVTVATVGSSATGGTCTVLNQTYGVFNMVAGVPVNWGSNLGTIFTAARNTDVCVQAGAVAINGAMTYDLQ
jgi:hypothetical protein